MPADRRRAEAEARLRQTLSRADTALEFLARGLRGALRAVESFPLTPEHLAPLVAFADAARHDLQEALDAMETAPRRPPDRGRGRSRPAPSRRADGRWITPGRRRPTPR